MERHDYKPLRSPAQGFPMCGICNQRPDAVIHKDVREPWTGRDYDPNHDGYPVLSPEGLAAITTDPEYQQRILTSVNQHAALVEQRDRMTAVLKKLRTWLTDSDGRTVWPEWIAEIDNALATVERGDETQAKGGSGDLRSD